MECRGGERKNPFLYTCVDPTTLTTFLTHRQLAPMLTLRTTCERFFSRPMFVALPPSPDHQMSDQTWLHEPPKGTARLLSHVNQSPTFRSWRRLRVRPPPFSAASLREAQASWGGARARANSTLAISTHEMCDHARASTCLILAVYRRQRGVNELYGSFAPRGGGILCVASDDGPVAIATRRSKPKTQPYSLPLAVLFGPHLHHVQILFISHALTRITARSRPINPGWPVRLIRTQL